MENSSEEPIWLDGLEYDSLSLEKYGLHWLWRPWWFCVFVSPFYLILLIPFMLWSCAHASSLAVIDVYNCKGVERIEVVWEWVVYMVCSPFYCLRYAFMQQWHIDP